jgi:hypothetical protein
MNVARSANKGDADRVAHLDPLPQDGRLQTATGHPVPAVRLGAAFAGMCKLLRTPFDTDLQQAHRCFFNALEEIRDFWTILGLPARTFGSGLSAALGQSIPLLEKLSCLENELRGPMDTRLRRLGTSYAHYEQFRSFYRKHGA